MTLSNRDVVERIAEVDFGKCPRAGWQDAVRRQIRVDAMPSYLKLVEREPEQRRRERPRFAFAFSTFSLAAAAALALFFVRDVTKKNRISERTRAIAMVVEFVCLETEMTLALAEIDSEQARMDEEFYDLLQKKTSEVL